MSETRFCEHCGVALAADARFCEACGRVVSAPSAPAETGAAPSSAMPRPSQRRWLIVGCVAVMAAIACVGVAAVGGFFAFKTAQAPATPTQFVYVPPGTTPPPLPPSVPTQVLPTNVPAPLKSECKDKLGCIDISSNDPIHLAYIMTVSGPDAALGLDTKYGVEIAIDDKGGKLLDHAIKFDGQDSNCSANGGTTAATKVVADKTIVAVIGTNCASEARAAMPILSQAGLSMVSPSNTAPDLTDPAKRVPGYFRTAFNDKAQGAAAAQFVREQLKLNQVAAIHDGSAYTDALAKAFADNFKKLGGSTVVESVKVGDRDMKPALTRVAASKPELIYFPVFDPEGGLICAQMRDVAGLEKTLMMGADGIFSRDFLKACGKNVIGMYLSSPDFSSFGGDYPIFVSKYLKKYNVKETLAPFHAHAYDATNAIFATIEKVAIKDPDGTLHIPKQALRDAIAATKDLKGLTGNLTCDPYGDCADPKIAVYQVTADNFSKLVMPDKPVWKQTR